MRQDAYSTLGFVVLDKKRSNKEQWCGVHNFRRPLGKSAGKIGELLPHNYDYESKGTTRKGYKNTHMTSSLSCDSGGELLRQKFGGCSA